jgi:hypothetical protein
LVGAVACHRPDARFAERFAPEFSRAAHTISVFGVYRDGQMSSEAWDRLRPRIEPLLGGSGCEIAVDAKLASRDRLLFGAIDDYARANGPNDDLLARVAPAAQGDLILVLVEAGRPPLPEKRISVAESSSQGRTPAGGHGSGFSTLGSIKRKGSADKDVLRLSASLFSVALQRSVALVDMQYEGTNFDEALENFATRLAQSLPEARCRGWHWSPEVNSDQIRGLDGG